MVFVMHLSLMIINFLIALLSNSLAVVLKDEEIIMTAQKISVVLTAEFLFKVQWPCLASVYYPWIIPKYFIVQNNRVYVSRTILANKRYGNKQSQMVE